MVFRCWADDGPTYPQNFLDPRMFQFIEDYLLSLKIMVITLTFCITGSLANNVASHQGLHCLLK